MTDAPKFYRRPFDEDLNGHGRSVWFFELEGVYASRQLELYRDGTVLAYHRTHLHDDFGMLADQPFELDDFAAFEITQAEFEAVWADAQDATSSSEPRRRSSVNQ